MCHTNSFNLLFATHCLLCIKNFNIDFFEVMVYAKNMKDLKIILKPNNNEVLIKNAIDNYFKTPNEKTLLTLICQSISYELALNGLNEIEFNVKKITPNASYVNNVINLNKKTLKNAKKVDF
jgi:hypothetical protein